jgi:hypothetical protein
MREVAKDKCSLLKNWGMISPKKKMTPRTSNVFSENLMPGGRGRFGHGQLGERRCVRNGDLQSPEIEFEPEPATENYLLPLSNDNKQDRRWVWPFPGVWKQ